MDEAPAEEWEAVRGDPPSPPREATSEGEEEYLIGVGPTPLANAVLSRLQLDQVDLANLDESVQSILDQYDARSIGVLDFEGFRSYVDHHPHLLAIFDTYLRENVWSSHGLTRVRATEAERLDLQRKVMRLFHKLKQTNAAPPTASTGAAVISSAQPTLLPVPLPAANTFAIPSNAATMILPLGSPTAASLGSSAEPDPSGGAGRGGGEDQLTCPSCFTTLITCPRCGDSCLELSVDLEFQLVRLVCKSPKCAEGQLVLKGTCNGTTCCRCHLPQTGPKLPALSETERPNAGVSLGRYNNCWVCGFDFSSTLHSEERQAQMEGVLFNKKFEKYFCKLSQGLFSYYFGDMQTPTGFLFLEGSYVEAVNDSIHQDETTTTSASTATATGSSSITTAPTSTSTTHVGGSGSITSPPVADGSGHDHTIRTADSDRSTETPHTLQFGLCIYQSRFDKRYYYAPKEELRDKWIAAFRDQLGQKPISDSYDMREVIGHGKFSIVYRAIELKEPRNENCARNHSCGHTCAYSLIRLPVKPGGAGVDESTGKVVAIKVVNKIFMTIHERDLLRSEISIMRMLRHPNVVQLRTVISSRDYFYIVMEYVAGGELYELISRFAPLSEIVVHRFMSQLFKTVGYLHRIGVVHRDLKPENILVTTKDIHTADLKIADFGLSAVSPAGTVLKHPCGTLTYAAPEILTEQGYNNKVDCWSLGVIGLFMLTGKLPYPPPKKNETPDFYTSRFDASAAWDLCSKSCQDFLAKILDVDPSKRLTCEQALEHIWLKNPTAVINDN